MVHERPRINTGWWGKRRWRSLQEVHREGWSQRPVVKTIPIKLWGMPPLIVCFVLSSTVAMADMKLTPKMVTVVAPPARVMQLMIIPCLRLA